MNRVDLGNVKDEDGYFKKRNTFCCLEYKTLPYLKKHLS